jgi:hypothetical protein
VSFQAAALLDHLKNYDEAVDFVMKSVNPDNKQENLTLFQVILAMYIISSDYVCTICLNLL